MIAALTLISNIVFFPSSTFEFMNMLEDNESDSQVKLVLARGCQQATTLDLIIFTCFNFNKLGSDFPWSESGADLVFRSLRSFLPQF